ncbi:SGNH/GDSL hydrolase family protein [Sphingobacterium sp. InxBP1]|uniref:SGNH/GDSL hydrolase family protein n=1 Tax=Sphingobacterium sp. InxBP1 TaxID=2870328 RepID=UPI002244CCA9|nr:SGNH/GDSL hydrolase family protein [Sphingobacterium sp. InxBP1]MCW8309911.1 SGNH/GDSL hydrolase family protein [Sphingobacterium sp. InxBP1]
MAASEEDKVRFPSGMGQATSVKGGDKIMLADADTGETKVADFDQAKTYLSISGIEMKAVAGGASSATPTILAPGPAGQNRKMEDVTGWFVNGTGNPLVAVGEPWEAPTGFKNTNWWDGTAGAWSLGSSVPLPIVPLSTVFDPNDTTKAATGKGTGDYLTANYLDNEKVGIKSYNIGDNIAPELSNSDFNDTSVWARGVLLADGSVLVPWSQYHTVKYYPIVAGTYICNLQLGSNGMAVVLYDKDRNVVKAYTNQANTDWNIVADEDGFIRFSKLSSQAVELDYCKTQQAYSGSIDDSNIVSKTFASDNLIGVNEPAKIQKILQPKFFKNATRNIDYSAFIDIILTGGSRLELKYPDGKWLDLYVTFIRIYGLGGSTSNTIVQIVKRDPVTGTVVLNQNVVASCNVAGPIIDENGYVSVDLTPVNNSNLYFSVIINTNKLTVGVDTGVTLEDTLHLDTAYLSANFKLGYSVMSSESGRQLGDSLTEFKTIPEYIGKNLGIPFLNCGVGGTRMSYHEDARYGALSFYKIAEAIADTASTDETIRQNAWNSVVNAINAIIPTVTAARQRRLERTRDNLVNTDWSKVTILTVWFGTNDFTVPLVPGTSTPPPIGEISLANKDVMTIVGAMNYGIDKIQSAYPQIRPNFVTPKFRYFDTGGVVWNIDDYVNPIGLKLTDVVDGIKQMAALNHLPCCDMLRDSGMNKYNHSLFYEDSTHDNELGAQVDAKVLSAFLKSKYFFG